jgi:hypothetical protein
MRREQGACRQPRRQHNGQAPGQVCSGSSHDFRSIKNVETEPSIPSQRGRPLLPLLANFLCEGEYGRRRLLVGSWWLVRWHAPASLLPEYTRLRALSGCRIATEEHRSLLILANRSSDRLTGPLRTRGPFIALAFWKNACGAHCFTAIRAWDTVSAIAVLTLDTYRAKKRRGFL